MNPYKTFKAVILLKWMTAILFAIVAISFNATAEVVLLDRVIAVVDDDVILQSELNQRFSTVLKHIQKSGTQAPPTEIVKQQVLEQLISERIQLNIGLNARIQISDKEINQTLSRIASGHGLSTDEYLAKIRHDHKTTTSVREQIRDELIIMRVQQNRVMNRIYVSDHEVDNFLSSQEGKLITSPDVNIGQILLSIPTNANATEVELIHAKLSDLLQQLEGGTDFRQLAIANSSDPSALEGGDLGWRKMAQLPEIFIQALENTAIGQVSKPIRSAAGLHLLKLYDRRGGDKQLIEQHFARHILIKPNEIRDETATIAQLNKLRNQVINGGNFSLLSKENSEDPRSALKGGELGWSTPGMFVPEFENVMNNIALNEVSAPFKSQFGWHILQVTERRQQDFSHQIMRNRAQNLLRQQKYTEELQVWLQEIRDEAFIEIKGSNEL